MLQLVFVTLAELVVGIFSGKTREAWASLRAIFGLDPPNRRASSCGDARSERCAGFPTARSPGCSCVARRGSPLTCAAATCVRRGARARSSDDGARPQAPLRCSPGSGSVGAHPVRQSTSPRGIPNFGEFLQLPEQPAGDVDRLPVRVVGSWPWADHAGTDGRGAHGRCQPADAVPHGPTAHGRRARSVAGRIPRHLALASLFPTARARIAALVVYAAVPLAVAAAVHRSLVARWLATPRCHGSSTCCGAAPESNRSTSSTSAAMPGADGRSAGRTAQPAAHALSAGVAHRGHR